MKNSGPLAFLRSVKVELDLVKWPTHAETVRMTAIVLIGSLLVGAYVGGLDIALTNLLTRIITR